MHAYKSSIKNNMYVDEFKDKWCLLADSLYPHLMILGLMDYLYLIAGKTNQQQKLSYVSRYSHPGVDGNVGV
jgi:hypothetical protein